jgi:NAD(P)-dependent dehydrogenase (short-subunit alcohol dehydrogenase family)
MTTHLTILTGGSRGMGAAMAEQLVDQGHWLVSIARKMHPKLQARAEAKGSRLAQWEHDLASPAEPAARLEAFLKAAGGEPLASVTLINNAGVVSQPGPVEDASPADLSNAIRVGLEAPVLLCAAFLRATDGWAVPKSILNISSGLGRRAMAGSAPYCAAKSGLDLFSAAVALDEARKPHGARICSLAPGVIDTDMQVQLRSSNLERFPDGRNFIALKEGGKLWSPQEAAAKVLGYLERPDFGAKPIADVRDA